MTTAILPIVASLTLGNPFADGTVLQRDRPVPVWGTADKGAAVTVSFAGQTKTSVADADGKWRVTLDPLATSSEGRTLTATSQKRGTEGQGERGKEKVKGKGERSTMDGKNSFVSPLPSNLDLATSQTFQTSISDVLVGEVWFSGGQSNMDVSLVGKETHYRDCQGSAFVQLTRMPHVRWTDHHNEWWAFTPENLAEKHLSAVTFYFARELSLALGDVPIGIVCRYTGGLNVEPWISRRGYELNGKLPQFLNWKRVDKEAWDESCAKGPITHWIKQPSVIYEQWIEPIAPFACRGAIWYQGEQNACHGEKDYDVKLDALLRSFEIAFDNPQLKFYMVQIPPPCGGLGFPESQQRFVDSHRKDGRVRMAVINDVITLGDVHCPDKEPVGRRLAYLALRHDYGFDKLAADSPVAVSCRAEGARMRVKVENGEGLYVYNAPHSYDSTFELAGADGAFKKAKIVNTRPFTDWAGKEKLDGGIQPGEIVLEAEGVASPVAVRYMHCKPEIGNVFNGGNLPLGAFSLGERVEKGAAHLPTQDTHDAERQKAAGL